MNASSDSPRLSWTALVMAAGRGPGDPLAAHFGVSHKCLIRIAGKAMLARVVDVLAAEPAIARIIVSIDDANVAAEALAEADGAAEIVLCADTAAASVERAFNEVDPDLPVLVTTADHALLDADMLRFFLRQSEISGADLSVAVASAETILAAYPNARRTFLTFGEDRVSGCNLYGLMHTRALAAVAVWRRLDAVRKKPWRLVCAFGPVALIRYLTGFIDLDGAFALASRRLGLAARAIQMPFANAAIDVDKPEDKELVEQVLAARRRPPTS